MAFKFIAFAACIAVARAGLIGAPAVATYAAAPAYASYAHAPVAYAAKTVAIDTDFDPNPSYSYSYDIQDALTGDNKNQQESRQGDVVQGSYSLNEPDGTRRTVEYTADPINGFNAVVHKTPLHQVAVAAPVVAKYAAPAVYHAAPAVARYAAAPAYASYAAPAYSAYAAPAYHGAYAAPAVAHYSAVPAVAKAHFSTPYSAYAY